MLAKDFSYNMKLSLNKFLREGLSPDYWINFLEPQSEAIERRINERKTGWWRWVELHWPDGGWGIFNMSLLQINCNTVIEMDTFGMEMERMSAVVQDELNVNSIPLLDFSDFVEAMSAGLVTGPSDISKYPPIPVDNVLIPRFRGPHPMPNAAGDTVNVKALSYNVYLWRESFLP